MHLCTRAFSAIHNTSDEEGNCEEQIWTDAPKSWKPYRTPIDVDDDCEEQWFNTYCDDGHFIAGYCDDDCGSCDDYMLYCYAVGSSEV